MFKAIFVRDSEREKKERERSVCSGGRCDLVC